MFTILVGPVARLFGRNLVLSTHGIIYKILMKIIFFFINFYQVKTPLVKCSSSSFSIAYVSMQCAVIIIYSVSSFQRNESLNTYTEI